MKTVKREMEEERNNLNELVMRSSHTAQLTHSTTRLGRTNYIRFIAPWSLFYEFLNEKLTKHKSY
jgi:hypothetical protein